MTVTLSIDVGGSDLKLQAFRADGTAASEHVRKPTPRPATPEAVLDALAGALAAHEPFDRVAVGFPGVVVDGVAKNAPNLDGDWTDVDLAGGLRERSGGRPVRVANDADVQGIGVVEGRGVELVLTLGTGCGSALFVDGRLVPNLELGHHPWKDGKTYEDVLGKAGLEAIGVDAWNRELRDAVALLRRIFNFRRLHLGGGNARLIRGELPDDVVCQKNEAALLGGLRLWSGS